ncbi:hypothetical protein HK100_004043 [Physocladia obscura]|uniref:Matrin-type domain-containing protein n=1 Tax=Physocladia obscura TaxID=109957 RepID=A0AAD5XA45_9FUNG|nr:hypothetical protein HK100_004043 [Physocladia obscura]
MASSLSLSSVLETQRYKHELIERLQEQTARDLAKAQRSKLRHLDRLRITRRISANIDRIQLTAKDLRDLYADESGARKAEIASISNAGNTTDFAEFYNRLKDVKDYYRKHPEEQVEILELEVAKVDEDDEMEAIENLFSGEEARGRFLDLNGPFEVYVNLKNVKRINYLAYISLFDKFDESSCGIPAVTRKSAEYKKYLLQLIEYLEGFCKRATPLVDLGALEEAAIQDADNWESSKQHEAMDTTDSDLLCKPCAKFFSNKNVFDAHLSGKKHKKAVQEFESNSTTSQPKIKTTQIEVVKKQLKVLELKIQKLAESLAAQREDTRDLVERKQTLSADEIEKAKAVYDEQDYGEDEEENFSADEEAEEEEENTEIYNPLKLPMGWDGKPIPYWLYKLHGLGVEYPCEICGNFIYMGRKAFDRHFQEWRHAHGMRCLGIPNTRHFQEITRIQDAYALHEKLSTAKKAEAFKAEAMEEFEDAEGNVFNKKTFEDLRRQGLL